MKSLPNLKSSVPVEVQTKLKSLADVASFDDIVTSSLKYAGYGEERTEEIEGNYVSRWMPKQDGGYRLSEYYMSEVDQGNFTDKQKEFNDDQYNQMYAAFLSDNDISPDTKYLDLTEDQKDSLMEYDREWFSDGALLTLDMFVDGYGEFSREPEKTVTIRLAINYKDAPYFREGYAEDIKQVVLSISEFLEMPNEEIIAQFSV